MKIKIELEGLYLEQATGLTNYLSSLSDKNFTGEVVSTGDVVSTELSLGEVTQDKPKQTRKRAEKVEAPIIETQEAESPEDAQEETKPEAIEVVEPETVSAPTLMQIRSLVAQKAADHKDAIKSKLAERGAQNVSTLDAKHFQTIFDFLTEL